MYRQCPSSPRRRRKRAKPETNHPPCQAKRQRSAARGVGVWMAQPSGKPSLHSYNRETTFPLLLCRRCFRFRGQLHSLQRKAKRKRAFPNDLNYGLKKKKKKKKLQKSHFSHFSQSRTFAYFLSNIHFSLVVAKNSYLAIFRQNTSSRRGRVVLTILEVVLTKIGKFRLPLRFFKPPRKTNRFENRLGLDLRSKFSDGVNEVNSEEFPPFTPSPFPPFTPSGLPYPYG